MRYYVCEGSAHPAQFVHCLMVVLKVLLSSQGFATLIREWPGELYNNMAIVQAVNDHLKRDPANRTLLTTLAEL